MATAFSNCLQNTNQKIPHKILGKVIKFQPPKKKHFRVMHKKPLELDRVNGTMPHFRVTLQFPRTTT